MIPPAAVLVATIVGFAFLTKVVELGTRPRERAERCPTSLATLAFLFAWPGMDLGAFLAPLEEARGPFAAKKLGGGGAKLVAYLALLVLGAALGCPERSFWLDHVLKLFEVYSFGSGGSDLLVGAFGLMGYRVLDVFRWPIAASSVLDFWIRYNRHVNGWLKRHVFDRFGRRHLTLGVLATFAASGVVHEAIFLPVVPALAGRQFAFFFGHGVVGLAAAWVGRAYRARTGRAVPSVIAHGLTLAFVIVSTAVFMSSVNAVLDAHRDLGRPLLRLVAQRP